MIIKREPEQLQATELRGLIHQTLKESRADLERLARLLEELKRWLAFTRVTEITGDEQWADLLPWNLKSNEVNRPPN